MKLQLIKMEFKVENHTQQIRDCTKRQDLRYDHNHDRMMKKIIGIQYGKKSSNTILMWRNAKAK
jgi:hypothetical protein